MGDYIAISKQNRSPGNYVSPGVLPSSGERRIELHIEANNWTGGSATPIIIALERSEDGGNSWGHWVSADFNRSREDDKVPGRRPSIGVPLYQGDNALVRVRLSIQEGLDAGLRVRAIEGPRRPRPSGDLPQSWAFTGRSNEGDGHSYPGNVNISLNNTVSTNFLAAAYTSWWSGGGGGGNISDNVNGNYTQAFRAESGSAITGIKYFTAGAGGNLVVNYNTQDSDCWVAVGEFSGGNQTSPLDGTPTTHNNGNSGPPYTTDNLTPSSGNVLLLASLIVDAMPIDISENYNNEGFTLIQEFGENWEAGSFVYKVISGAAGTVRHNWTSNANSALWAAGIAAFVPSVLGVAVSQTAFRFRRDDGNEALATWDGFAGSNMVSPTGTNRRIRLQVAAPTGSANVTPQLECRKTGHNKWVKVPLT